MSAEPLKSQQPDKTLPMGMSQAALSGAEETIVERQTHLDSAMESETIVAGEDPQTCSTLEASSSLDKSPASRGQDQRVTLGVPSLDETTDLSSTIAGTEQIGETVADESKAKNELLDTVVGEETNQDKSRPSNSGGLPSSSSADASPQCGRYVLKRFHARGGMGEVWLAEDPVIGRQVALKRMLRNRPEQVQRFEAEAQVTGQLEHPGIVPIHELAYDADGQPFYVMKFLQGKTLHRVIKEFHAEKATEGGDHEVALIRLLHVFISLCQTVAYAHSKGVVHRDLKPDNVMQGPYGETILLDWGIAKIVGEPEGEASEPSDSCVRLNESAGSQETRAGVIMGTPMYMAPEVASGNTEEVDHRSDVFLLGAVLYEILTGHQPRSAKTAFELVRYAKVVSVVPARQVCLDVPKALEAVCGKAMALSKEDRYQSALALAEEVQRYLAGEPVLAYPEPWPARVWRWGKRHRTGLTRLATAASILAILAFGATKLRQVQRQAQRLQEREAARREILEFRRLADEARFYAATTDPVSEQAPYFDPIRGATAAKSALALAARWGADWVRLPFADERAPLRNELDELRLVMAQMGLAQEFQPARGKPTALDHFLRGEKARRASGVLPALTADGRKDWEADPGGLAEAMAEYRQAIAIKPDDYWSHLQLGRCYVHRGDFPQGIEALGTCIALRPNAPWGYGVRGLALGLAKRYGEAQVDLDHAVALAPEFRPAKLNRGVVFWIQGKHDQALSDFADVLSPPASKQLAEAAFYRGQLYLQQGATAKALEDFHLIIFRHPQFRPAYRYRARIYLAQGDVSLAFQDLDQYGNLVTGSRPEPNSWQLPARRGHFLRNLYVELPSERRAEATGQRLVSLAIEQLTKAESLGGQSPVLFDDLGAMLEHAGQQAKAVAAYTRGLDLAPNDLKLRLKRAWAHQLLGRIEESLADFSQVARVAPENAEAHSGLGYVSVLRKRPSDAQREADLALLYGDEDPKALHNVACIYASLSEIAQRQANVYQDVAIALLRKSVTLWKGDEAGLTPQDLMQREPAFRTLRSRADFQQLLQNKPAPQVGFR